MGLWCKWRHSWRGEVKAECLYWFFSSIFRNQKINMWPPPNFFEQSLEDWAVQSVMCSQSKARQSPRIWLPVKGTGIYWTGVLGRKEPGGLRREPWGGKVQSMCSEQQWSWEEFSRTLKSNRITASKDFSISPVNKGTDQRKSPVWIVCLGSSSSRSSTLRGDSRRYKQKSISWYFN